MIQQEELTGLMNGTIPFTDESLSGFSDMIEQYPYFQAAHLLHTLNLLHLKDTRFLYDLRKTAIYAPDRRQLFFWVEKDSFDAKLIKAIEDETIPIDSTLDLIEKFLSESDEKTVSVNTEKESSAVSTDYVSYFLSDIKESEEAPPLQHQSTIDKFLERDAASPLKIKLKKTDEPVEEFPESIPETQAVDGFFTETLAKIFIKQKKYDKALEIIHNLNLIYPEKSSYFADQIRFLEKLIKYSNKIK